MQSQRETVNIGLQQGDTCRVVTTERQTIYLRAIKTRGGYVSLEIDMPKRFWADKIRARDQSDESLSGG